MTRTMRSIYLWACELLYDELAWSYDWVSWLVSCGGWSVWRRFALEAIVGDDVLEIGFGTGTLLGEMAGRGLRVTGLERSAAMHRIAARRGSGRLCSVQRVLAVAQRMPFAAARFDSVVSTFPAPYILEPATLQECRRVLRSDGCLVVVGLWVTPRRDWLRRLLPVFYSLPSQAGLDAVSDRMQRAGFHLEFSVRTQGWVDVAVLVAHVRPDGVAVK